VDEVWAKADATAGVGGPTKKVVGGEGAAPGVTVAEDVLKAKADEFWVVAIKVDEPNVKDDAGWSFSFSFGNAKAGERCH
jgi:hypothetical protein